MLTIKKRLIQPMTALYVTTGIAAFAVTLGGLLIFRPDFTPNQAAAFDNTRQQVPMEVRTASATKTSAPSESRDSQDGNKPLPTVAQLTPQQTNASAYTTKPTEAQPSVAPESQPEQPTQVTPEPETPVPTTPEPTTPTDPVETEQQTAEQPSLLQGVVNLLDAII